MLKRKINFYYYYSFFLKEAITSWLCVYKELLWTICF